MIEITNLTKRFGKTVALNRLNCTVQAGSVFGLVGSNGSGKSTLLRILAGVFEADGGTVRFEGKPSFENREIKAKIFFIADYPYFFNDSNIQNTARLYRNIYPSWDEIRLSQL